MPTRDGHLTSPRVSNTRSGPPGDHRQGRPQHGAVGSPSQRGPSGEQVTVGCPGTGGAWPSPHLAVLGPEGAVTLESTEDSPVESQRPGEGGGTLLSLGTWVWASRRARRVRGDCTARKQPPRALPAVGTGRSPVATLFPREAHGQRLFRTGLKLIAQATPAWDPRSVCRPRSAPALGVPPALTQHV